MPDDATRDEWPDFVKEWESTSQNESAMNQMLFRLIGESTFKLSYRNYVTFHPPTWIKDIKTLELGQCMDKSYARSHRGLSILAIAGMRISPEEAAIRQSNWDRWNSMTLKTGEDVDMISGQPGVSPNCVMELIADIDCYLIYLHCIIGLRGSHQVQVKRLRDVLMRDFANATMTQRQIDDIFWSIYTDSRNFFKQTNGNAQSTLNILVQFLSSNMIPAAMNVPYAQLSGTVSDAAPVAKKRKLGVSFAGDGVGGVATQPKAHGAMAGYNPILKAQWKKTLDKLGPDAVIRDMLKAIKQPGGKDNWSLKSLNFMIKDNRCMVGTITGTCTNPKCVYAHGISSNDGDAQKIATVIDEATRAVSAGG